MARRPSCRCPGGGGGDGRWSSRPSAAPARPTWPAVVVRDSNFSPARQTIAAGDTVVFARMKDTQLGHSVTSDTGAFDQEINEQRSMVGLQLPPARHLRLPLQIPRQRRRRRDGRRDPRGGRRLHVDHRHHRRADHHDTNDHHHHHDHHHDHDHDGPARRRPPPGPRRPPPRPRRPPRRNRRNPRPPRRRGRRRPRPPRRRRRPTQPPPPPPTPHGGWASPPPAAAGPDHETARRPPPGAARPAEQRRTRAGARPRTPNRRADRPADDRPAARRSPPDQAAIDAAAARRGRRPPPEPAAPPAGPPAVETDRPGDPRHPGRRQRQSHPTTGPGSSSAPASPSPCSSWASPAGPSTTGRAATCRPDRRSTKAPGGGRAVAGLSRPPPPSERHVGRNPSGPAASLRRSLRLTHGMGLGSFTCLPGSSVPRSLAWMP